MNFLLITKEYPPSPSVSGRIAETICCELINAGNNVTVLTRSLVSKEAGIGKNGESLYYVRSSYWERLYKRFVAGETGKLFKIWYRIVQSIRKLILVFRILSFPDSEPNITKKGIGVVSHLISDGNQYDCAIAFFRPFSCLEVLLAIKQLYGVHSIAYYLDLVESKDCPSFMPQKLYEHLIKRGDQRVFDSGDQIILPVSSQTAMNELQIQHKDKIQYFEFPTFITREYTQSNSKKHDNNTIVLLYAGTLSKSFRNPINMLEIIDKASEYILGDRVVLKIYGKCDCSELIDDFKCGTNFTIEHHGAVSKEIIEGEYESADFLINIMNSYKSIVPSKIFELFSTGKPILNFATEGDDGSMPYFQRYPLQFTVLKNEAIQLSSQNVAQFLNENIGKHIETDQIEREFENCTPKYIAQAIIGLANGDNNTINF